MDFQNIRSSFLSPKIDSRKVASHLVQLSQLYTINRRGLNNFEWNKELVSAYTSFYLPTNIKKIHFLLDQLSPELLDEFKSCEVIDFGTGPGTYILGLLEYFGESHFSSIWGIDKEPLMLEQAKKLCGNLFPGTKNIYWTDCMPYKGEQKRLLIFGNSSNEMGERETWKVIEDSKADFVLFIEPGTPLVFDQMMLLRKKFQMAGFDCLYPCASITSICPMAKKIEEGQEDWCHQVWRGVHDIEVERIGQLAKLDRKTMPFIGHLYCKGSINQKNCARLVRFIRESKFAFDWEVCFLENEKLVVKEFEVIKKSIAKKELKRFQKLSVGIGLEYEVIKKLSDEKWRVSVQL